MREFREKVEFIATTTAVSTAVAGEVTWNSE